MDQRAQKLLDAQANAERLFTVAQDRGYDGGVRHWIYEIHFVDRAREIGGFFEQLLTA